MVLRNLAIATHIRADLRLVKNRRILQPFCFPVFNGLSHLEQIGPTYHFVDGTKTQLSHEFTHLLSDETHEIDHMCRIAGKFLAQLRILRRYPYRAGVKMTDPHHNTAQRHQSRSGETKLFRTEQRSYHNITAGL